MIDNRGHARPIFHRVGLAGARAARLGPGRIALIATAIPALAPAAAHAQFNQTTLLGPTIPEGFDRGRNISVTERERPDYDAVGIRLGVFNAYPRIDVAAGYSSNVYLSSVNAESAAYLATSPSLRLNSDWSRHLLQIRAGGQVNRFIGEPRRKEDAANLGVLGRYDIGSFSAITGEVQVASQFETPFSGEVSSELAVLSRFRRDFESVRFQYGRGQGRVIGALDHTGLDFSRIKLGDGRFIDQGNRDRDLTRATAQFDYAFTPSISIYAQGAGAWTRYDRLLSPGVANRDSNGFRVIGGSNFDISGLARGTIGVGYIRRDYRSNLYKDVGGFSAEMKVEYFPTELTTFTLAARRVIEDSTLGTNNAFFDNRVSLRVDHELRRNILLNVYGDIARQDYIGTPIKADVYRVQGGARYLVSRRWGLEGGLSYTGRSTQGLTGQTFGEFRGQIGFFVQR